MESNWETELERLRNEQNTSQFDLAARRREFLKSMGLNRANIQKHRLRPQDGLSEEAWWAAARQAMRCVKNHGEKNLGKPIPKSKRSFVTFGIAKDREYMWCSKCGKTIYAGMDFCCEWAAGMFAKYFSQEEVDASSV